MQRYKKYLNYANIFGKIFKRNSLIFIFLFSCYEGVMSICSSLPFSSSPGMASPARQAHFSPFPPPTAVFPTPLSYLLYKSFVTL
nr:MAG TPA: hypothetical protein [Caudoviricetes sp.]DAQ19899.1 MAG TPA: hypothetical protein [Caudoviricetes sp.]DAX28870.1 MAG TPA: hypothetical protein [Caudoviricetes sp.]